MIEQPFRYTQNKIDKVRLAAGYTADNSCERYYEMWQWGAVGPLRNVGKPGESGDRGAMTFYFGIKCPPLTFISVHLLPVMTNRFAMFYLNTSTLTL